MHAASQLRLILAAILVSEGLESRVLPYMYICMMMAPGHDGEPINAVPDGGQLDQVS